MNERPDRPLTWEDVLRMPDDGNRYEFIGGRLYVTPAPVIRHHRVSERLQSALRRALGAPGHGDERVGVIDLVEVFSRHLDVWEESST